MKEWAESWAGAGEGKVRAAEAGLCLAVLAAALRRLRPFKKFRRAGEVPGGFVRRRERLRGRVVGLAMEPGPLLLLDHRPLLAASLRAPAATRDALPVALEGVDLSAHGVSWLLAVVVGRDVEVTLLARRPSSLACLVSLGGRSVGSSLVSLGFASVAALPADLSSDPLYDAYYRRLLKAEARAERRRLGIWWGAAPPSLADRLLDLLPSLRLRA